MKIEEKITNFVQWLRQLSKTKRQIIFFTIMTVAVLIVGFFEVIMAKNNLAAINNSIKEFELPEIDLPEPDFGPGPIPGFNSNDIDTGEIQEFLNETDYSDTTQADQDFFQDSPGTHRSDFSN